MNFRISTSHIKKQNRRTIYLALFFSVIIIILIAILANAKKSSDMLMPAIGIFLFSRQIFLTYKHLKEGGRLYPTIDLDETAAKITVNYKDVSVSVDINKIKNLRLQYKSERLLSVILATSSGQVMRFEGYENLEKLAEALEKLTPSEKITKAKFYHR